MGRWFWILALGFSAVLFATFSIGAPIFAIWHREFSLEYFSMIFGNAMIAWRISDLFFLRVHGPPPQIEPIDLSFFDHPHDNQ
jgi:hypothetical protein